MTWKLRILALLAPALVVACGGGAPEEASETSDARRAEAAAAREAHYEKQPSLPPAVREAYERGEISEEALDARIEAGEFERFFVTATPAEIPADLTWEDGSQLPEFSAPDARKGGTLQGAIQDFPRTLRRVGPDSNGSFRPYILDDVVMGFGQRHPVLNDIVDSNFLYYPGIAREWALDRDSLTVYVRINPDARWSDGEAITVDDVFFMFYFYQSEWIKAPWYSNFYTRSYTRLTRYDDLTFSITLPEAKPDMLGRVLGLEPLPEHFFADFGEDYVERYQWSFVPTSGAYVVREEDIKKGRSIALTRNPQWWAQDLRFWRNRFNYDRIQLSVIRDTAKRFEAFRKGEQDVFGISLPEYFYDKLPDDDPLVANGYVHKYVFYNERPRPTYGLWINSAQPLLDQRDVRVGIQFATNWKKVIDEYFRGDYARMNTTADGFGEFTHPELQARPFDIDRALEAFARAGFAERGEDGVLVNAAGQRLSFTLTTGYEALKDVLTILREEALQAGLEFRIEVLDSTAAFKKAQEKQHDITFSAFNVGPEMYPRYWETYHSVNAFDRAFDADGSINPERKVKAQTNNLQSVAIPELDALIERYRASDDAEEMRRIAFRMEEMIHEDASFVPGFVIPFYRTAAWRWMRWPEFFDVRLSSSPLDFYLGWIDEDAQRDTRAAVRENRTFPPVIEQFQQYRRP